MEAFQRLNEKCLSHESWSFVFILNFFYVKFLFFFKDFTFFLLVCSMAVHWHQFLFFACMILTLRSFMKWISHRWFFLCELVLHIVSIYYVFKRWTFRFWFIAFWCNTLCALRSIKVIHNIKFDFWLWSRPVFFSSFLLLFAFSFRLCYVSCGFYCFDPVGFHSSWIVTSCFLAKNNTRIRSW